MAVKRDRQMLIDVARMYYVDDLDQGAIGARMGLSKSSVSRILSAAKTEGIIQVRIVGDETVLRDRALEEAVASEFGLSDVFVASPTPGLDPLAAAAKLGAEIFRERAYRARRIGFGWGLTVQRMIESIPPVRLGAEQVLTSLVGGMPTVDTAPSGNNMIVTLAEKSGTRSERFDAPAVVESELTWTALMQESTVKRSLANARKTELAFVGIGTFGINTSRLVVDAMKLSHEEREVFEEQAPVGDMCGHYFNIEGEALEAPSSRRVIGISIDQLSGIPTVVGIAAGIERTQGVVGALATGALEVLCLDDVLARALLDIRAQDRDSKQGNSGPKGGQAAPLIRCPNCSFLHA